MLFGSAIPDPGDTPKTHTRFARTEVVPAKTETPVRVYDDAGRLTRETVTTVVEKPVIQKPPGFIAAEPQGEEGGST